MSEAPPRARPRSVLPWQAVVVIVVLIAGGIYLLIPDDEDLIQRYLDAGQPEKVIEHLERDPDLGPEEAAVVRVEALGRIASERKAPELWEQTFKDGFSEYVTLGGPERLRGALLKVIPHLQDPSAVAVTVDAAAGSLPVEAVDPIMQGLVEEIVADGDPAQAAAVYREWLGAGAADSGQIAELLRLRRLAGEEEQALQDLIQLKQSIAPGSAGELRLALEKATLLQSLNRVNEAFEQLLEYWEANPGAVSDPQFFQLARSLSIAADRQKDVVPIMQARLGVAPGDDELFADYLDLNLALAAVDEAERALEEKRRTGMLTPGQARMLARIREWSGKPGEAFEEYRRLALEGDQEALQRLFELNEGLYRHYELAEILAEAPGTRSSDNLLREARLLARIGEYERAVESYRALVDQSEEPDPGWYAEMADVALTIHDFETALYGLRMGLESGPSREQEIRWKKDIGWILSLEGEYELAVAAYAAVFLDYEEEDVLPSIVSLSTLIGDRDLYQWTMEEIVRRNRDRGDGEGAANRIFRQKEFGAERRWQTALNQYTRSLAQIYADEGRYEDAAEVIVLNSEIYTDSEIFEFLLNVLAEAKQFEEAAQVLEEVEYSPGLLQTIETYRTAIWILESAGRPEAALELALIARGTFPGDESMKLTTARLLSETGRVREARQLLDTVDMEDAPPGVLLLASGVASASGQFARAETLMLEYLDNVGEPAARDFTQLGDLRLAAGDVESGREAYREAVRILQEKAEDPQTLTSSDREEMAYLYARLRDKAQAEPLAADVLENEPTNLRILLVMASLYLDERVPDKVIAYAERILRAYPKNKDALFFLAAGYQLAGNPGKARTILQRLRDLYPEGTPFPFELDLASASLQAGDWPQAVASYQRVLRKNQVAPPLRRSVRLALDAIYREHLPMVRVGFSDIDAGTGTVREYGGFFSVPLNQRMRLGVDARHRETSIAGTVTTNSDSSATGIYEATLRYERPPRFDFRLTGRVFDGEPGFGVGLARANDSGRGGQTLSYDSRTPATDSLNMRYLFGWEDRLNLLIEQPIGNSWQIRSNLYHRWVFIESERFGKGFGADWELTRYQRLGPIDLFLSYRGAYSDLSIESDNLSLVAGLPYLPGFGPTPEVVEGLSANRVHREGVGINVSRNLRERWIFSANAGLDYYFFLRELTWYAGGGVIYRPLKSVDVRGDLSYSSADNRGDENADNLQILLGVTNRF